MSNFESQPLKLYIQDIYRATRTEKKYIYELFNLTFKKIMIHGVVTSTYNLQDKTTNFELSDPTGTVQVYYDTSKSDSTVKNAMIDNLNYNFAKASKFGDVNIVTMSKLMDRIKKNKLDIKAGDVLSVVGDIFLDERGLRMICAYNCIQTSIERDIVWLEELRYLYEKYYLCREFDNNNT